MQIELVLLDCCWSYCFISGCEIEKDSDSFQQNYESYSSFEQPSEFISNEQSNNLISDEQTTMIKSTCLAIDITAGRYSSTVNYEYDIKIEKYFTDLQIESITLTKSNNPIKQIISFKIITLCKLS